MMRREWAACRGCGAERHVFRGDCEECGAPVCSVCCVEENNSLGLCRWCAVKHLNQALAPLVPICVCADPAILGWSALIETSIRKFIKEDISEKILQ
jgi:hypothetical protein